MTAERREAEAPERTPYPSWSSIAAEVGRPSTCATAASEPASRAWQDLCAEEPDEEPVACDAAAASA